MKEPLCFTGADIITPFRVIPGGIIVVEGKVLAQVGRADAVRMPAQSQPIDLPGRKILPGYVDLHLHGFAGQAFEECGAEGFEKAATALLAHGTTSALITLGPAPTDRFFRGMVRVRSYLDQLERSSVFCGIHAEGPFLNPEMHGALNTEGMWPADPGLAELLFDSAGPWLKLMTIAPEIPGAMDIIRRAVRRGIVVSVGHSRANYQEIEDALDCGLAQVTHIFNAMPLAHHRDPGVLGAAYTHQELKVQLIADGVHVHPAIMNFLVKVKGAGSVLLVSDAIPACGLPDGEYTFGARTYQVHDGGAWRDDGTLAGSVLALDGALRNMVQLGGIPLGDTARMAGLNPARVLNLDDRKGTLAAGSDADFVVLSPDLTPEMTVVGGRIAWSKGPVRAGECPVA